MIIKEKDSKQSEIDELSSLLALNLPEGKKSLIKKELNCLKSGERGEKDSAYYIDFDFDSSKNHAVIHDLRLEFENKVAQIDHLVINRLFDFYVLESKNFSDTLKITTEGEFLKAHNNKYNAITSPIEQNRRHIFLLDKVIKHYNIMPTRLGIQLSPTFRSYILVSPQSRVIKPSKEHFDASMVIKADTLRSQINKEFDERKFSGVITDIGKLSSAETVMEITRKLAKLHKPAKIDFKSRFGITEKTEPPKTSPEKKEAEDSSRQSEKKFYCSKCKKSITKKVADFCWQNKERFGGRAYCYDCQKDITK